ncbi:MAG: amino acid adenylation domain-containing protein, partial [Chitinophagaceae bacterium]
HFFEAGGDSIKAIQLSSLLYHNGWELEVKAIFQHPVLEEMATYMQSLFEEQPFIHAPEGEDYEVSAAQRRLWFINQLEDNPTVYNMLSALAIEGVFDRMAFTAAIRQLVERHEILRTVFITVNNSPRQKIVDYSDELHGYEFIDLSAKQNQNSLLNEIFRVDGGTPFDLEQGPLFRLKLVCLKEDLHVLVMNFHHIINDGWSKTILEEEFLELFTNLAADAGFQLPQPVYQYKDYAAWQAKYFSGNAADEHRNYWMEQLKGELPILQFPADRPRPSVKEYASKKVSIVLPSATAEQLRQLAGEQTTTDFTLLLSAVQVLLKRYSGQDDIITGIPSAGRSRPELSRMAGLFFNLLPLRTQFAADETFLSLINKLKQQTTEAYEHADYPFDHLIEQLRVQRDLSRSALFDVLVVSQDFGLHDAATRTQNGFAIKEVETGFSGNKFDLTFYFRREQKGLSMTIGYNATLFNAERIQLLVAHFSNLLEQLVFFPANDILSGNYLTPEETNDARANFNNTIQPYSHIKLLYQLFEEAAEKYPTAEALRHNGDGLSYQALNSSANKIARQLLESGVVSGNNVGILTGRNFSMIQGMLGILKAGAAYVPIDPAYPADRQRYIVTNSDIHFILTDDADVAANAISGLDDIIIIDTESHKNAGYDDSNFIIDKPATDLAYTIYTSGSSGRPKGVMIEHHSAVNLVEWVNNEYNIGCNDRLLFLTSMCFDLSVYDIFGMLAAGGCIVIATIEDVQDLARIKQLLIEERISFWDTVPTTLNYLVTELAHANDEFIQSDLKVAFLSGDWIPVTLPPLAKKFFPNVNVISLGGATEGTVWSNYFPIKDVDAKWTSIPYGKPITNNFFYILDEALNPVPQGVTGELFIGGVGVSRGYINEPVKTAAAFIADPFCKELGGRMYRTGDLGRMLPDGNMEFLGRKDFQVKIRGYRIELGEIENALHAHAGVEAAVVIARTNDLGDKELVAYIVSKPALREIPVSADNYRTHLLKTLPAYMVPAHFVQLEALPLTGNGKIDRKALPAPEELGMQSGNAYVAPRTETEVKLSTIWQEITGKERIGINDNFFELGGHSLKITRLASQIHKTFDVKLALRDLFISVTLKDQSQLIATTQGNVFESLLPVEIQEDYMTSPAQRRLWIMSRLEQGNEAYNIPAAYLFEGEPDHAAFENAFAVLIARHESLRTVFKQNSLEIRQVVLSPEKIDFSIAYEDLSSKMLTEKQLSKLVQAEFVKPFDFAAGPLLRAGLYKLNNNKWLFICVIHHIVTDGWSMGILIRELLQLYNAQVSGRPISLPPLKIQYKDYADWQHRRLNDESMAMHKAYWLQQMEGELPLLQVPGDKVRPVAKTHNGATVSATIEGQYINKLRSLSMQQGGTLFMGLLATVNTLLYRYTGQEDIVTGTQIAGREHADLEAQVGMYLNTLPLRVRFNGEKSFIELLESVKQTTLAAYDHQAYPFDELVDALDLERDRSRHPIFDVSVVLQTEALGNILRDEQFAGLKVSSYEDSENIISKFDLQFDFTETGDAIQAKIVYNTDIYSRRTVEQLMNHLKQLMVAVIEAPAAPLCSLDYLNESEKQMLVHGFNQAWIEYPETETIAQLFTKQVALTPGKTALIFGEKQLTYAELEVKANRMAHYLRQQYNIMPDDFIGIMLDRSEKLIISILAVLKSGAAYVPVDPDYPKARKEFMLQDTSVKVLITQTDYIFDLDFYQGDTFVIDVQLDQLDTSAEAPSSINQSRDLAYVMYTSGSTGKPKGVMIEQRSVVKLVKSINYMPITGNEVFLSSSSASFDASTFEYWGALLNGGQLVLCSKETLLDEKQLREEIRNRKVTTMWFTSGWLNELVDKDITLFKGLETIIAGGDKLSPTHINMLKIAYPAARIINGYGPTEITTFSLSYTVPAPSDSLPIGKPVSNSNGFIIDAHEELCPIGVIGEICSGGHGVARGYLNNPEMTMQKFIPNPFVPGDRIYKSGDLGRWLPDGNVEFMGRKDDQVKIRGFRIELGELENCMERISGVEKSSVLVRQEGAEKSLVAYFSGDESLDGTALRAKLSDELPEYMLPTQYIYVALWPLTSNGKTDKAALRKILKNTSERTAQMKAPETPLEKELAEFFEKLLGLESLGTDENLFSVGLDSLKVIRAQPLLEEKYPGKVRITDLFSQSTISKLSNHIQGALVPEKETTEIIDF